MTEDDFVAFFHRILDEVIPSDARDAIKATFSAKQTEPEFAFADEDIKGHEEKSHKQVICAGIRGNTFCFRKQIVEETPEFVLLTMVQHELIHIILPQKRKTNQISRPKKTPFDRFSLPTDTEANALLNKCRLDAIYENEHETEVQKLNDSWGGQEALTRDWLRKKGFL